MAIKLDRVQKTDLAARNTLGIQAKVDEREFAAHNCCVEAILDAFHTYRHQCSNSGIETKRH